MSSTIFYKFKSQNGSSRILFDGTGLTVFDLKREIIQNNKLGDGTDFQLKLYHPDTNEEYEEDQTVIPRSTSVIVKRSPAIKSILRGKSIGNATRYITGKPRVHQNKKLQALATTNTTNTGLSEEERIASMFANQENQWEQTQHEMSTATPVFFKNTNNNNSSADDGPPPPGYMCYRCGARDHWIKNCPTNNDPNFEGKRIKRTTGIPKKFLKSVEIDPNNITPEEMAQRKIMVTDDGKFVVQVADEHSWEDYQRKQQKRLIDNDEAIWQKDHFTNLPDDLKCPLTKGLLRDPVKTTNCCNNTFSKIAIENALLESDFICPSCNTHDILLDSLQEDTEKQKQVQLFLKQNDHQHKRQKLTPTTNAATTTNAPTTNTNPPMPFPFPFPMFPPLPFIPNNKP